MFKGFTAIVTGGASGLGKATAENIVRLGGRVVLCDIQNRRGKEVAESLQDKAIFVETDIASESGVAKAMEVCKERFGRLDATINCAGISALSLMYRKKHAIPVDLSTIENLLKTNVSGTFNVIRQSIALMADNPLDEEKGERGVIINAIGTAAFDGVPSQLNAMADGAIHAITLPLAREFASYKVRVCSIATGLFDTPLMAGTKANKADFIEEITPFPKRLGRPEEFSHLCLHILTNPMLNGETLRLDGALRYAV